MSQNNEIKLLYQFIYYMYASIYQCLSICTHQSFIGYKNSGVEDYERYSNTSSSSSSSSQQIGGRHDGNQMTLSIYYMNEYIHVCTYVFINLSIVCMHLSINV
jgi:hypothetical protein